jgi:meso-butanediol dehydrogenase / (S,S)-butanediol dehydrogenase / diacetyl reductase
MKRLEGKVAVVTGAASGIGAATVRRFAAEGARIAALDVNEPAPDAWAAIVTESPPPTFVCVDVRDEERVARAVDDAVARFGRLDVVVNAAGVAGGGAVHMLDAEEWDRIVGINLKGTFLVCKHALRPMVAQRGGAIVNLASIEGLEGTEGGSAYNASKGGVVLLTKNLAIDYGRLGIRVNCICPGFIETPMTMAVFDNEAMKPFYERFVDAHQLGRTGKPEEIAAAALFLASVDASFVTGHALVVDGGFTAGRRIGFAKMMGLE